MMSEPTTTYHDFVWPHSTGEETRTPLFTFQGFNDDATYGFYFLSIHCWLNVLCCILLVSTFSALTGVLVYYTILKPRKHQKPGIPLQANGLLMALGVVLPFWILAPKPMLEYFGIRNMLFRFLASGVTPTVAMFRTTEAVFGFTPEHAKRSAGDFCLFFGSTLLLRFDDKSNTYIRTTPAVLAYHLSAFLGMLFAAGIWQSCFISLSFFPELGGETLPKGWYHWENMFSLERWKDNLIFGVLFLFYITSLTEGFAVLTQVVTGIQTQRVNIYPLTRCTSPGDFWGRRWNRVVHACLKNGVYKPVRSMGGSSALAVLAAFVASGLFHEGLLISCVLNYEYSHGGTTFFFVWNAMLVAAEKAIGHWTIFQVLSRNLPALWRSLLLVCLSLPAGHYFLDPYVNSKFFLHGNVFFPMILPMAPV